MFRPVTRARGAFALLLAACSATATAQVQRTFVNLGFELPSAGSSSCFFQVDESTVPGWTTNHPSQSGNGCAPLIPSGSGKLIEIWANGFNGVTARSGTQFAELNAEAASRIFQNVCLATGEPIGWRFSHRGRQSGSVDDVAEFRVGSTAGANQVVRAATQNDGGFSTPTCYNTAASSSGISDNSCTAPALSGTWRDYAGTFTWNGTTGVQAIGFEAISAAGGGAVGNFIDDIQVTLRPFVELSDAALSVREGASGGLPTLRVVGTVPAGGISVTLQVQASSSATRGSDYTTAGSDDTVIVTVPAGVYDGNDIALPLSLVDDAAVEDNEVINLAIVSSPTNYVLSSTRTCGGTPILASSVSLLDNEVDLATTLQAPASAIKGSTVTLTATFANNTAAPTQGDTAARTANAAIALAQPAGLTFTGWTCTASHGAQCPGGAVNATTGGTGAVSGTAALPAGNAAAGGSLSYSIQAEVTADYCSSVALTATIATPTPLAEATSVQSGFVTPAPGGTANNAAAASIAVACANAPPVITTTAPTQATRGEPYRYDVDATDADNDVLAYNLDTQPAGMSIDAASGLIEWTPGEDQVGIHSVSVRVSDGRGGQTVQSFSVTVIAVNRPPRITSTPVITGVTGQAYAYDVSASDADNDTLSYTLVQAPAGMSIDPLSGFITWTPADSQLAAADVIVQVSDPHGASDTQEFRVVVNASLIGRSHLGTEFWFLQNLNFYTCANPDLCIPANSPDRRLSVTVAALDAAQGYVEVPGLSFRQDFSLSAGNVAEIVLPWQALHTTDDMFQALNKGVHVVADAPVTVVATNRAKNTTDSALIYPVDVLGTHYTAADYPTYSGQGGQLGIVALHDNTRITFLDDATHTRALPAGLSAGQDWSIILQRGQTYSASNTYRNAPYEPYSGMPIVASAPIAVFGGSTCSDVPTNAMACDHLFEQLLPDRNLGQRFVAGTLATRTAGNMYRFVATQNRTAVYSGAQLVAVLDAGEAAERVLSGPVEIRASQPIHVLLLAQSESVDSGQRTLPADIPPGGEDGDNELLDPFLIALPPVGTELTDYLFTTPTNPAMTLHYADVVIADSAAALLRLDGAPVTGVNWQPLSGGRVHGNLRLSPGRHRLQASAPFALSVYGYGHYESYGYAGGLLIGNPDRVRRLDATPLTQTRTLGDSACFSLVLRDEQGHRVPYARVGISVDGAWPRVEARFADGTGQGEYCFEQPTTGRTALHFQSGHAQAEAEVIWLAPTDGINRAPVITSLPRLELHEERFEYTVQALDPNGDTPSYVLVSGPPGAQINALTGVLSWTAAVPPDRRQQLHDFRVRAVDPQGLYAEQQFTLRLTFNALMTPLAVQDVDAGATYSESFRLLGDQLESPTLITPSAPPGSEVLYYPAIREWAFNWRNATSPALRQSKLMNLGSRSARIGSAGFSAEPAWNTNTNPIVAPVFGRPLDTNSDGVVNASDRLVAAGIYSDRLTLRFADTGVALPGSGTAVLKMQVIPAFVDLDSDGKDEIVYASSTGKLVALDGANQRRWAVDPDYGISNQASVTSSIESADLDNNGTPEIIAGGRVYGADGSVRWSFGITPPASGGSFNADDIATPLIVDLDGNGSREVLYFNEMRRADGSLGWRLPEDGLTAPLTAEFTSFDIEGDGQREVFAVVKDRKSTPTWRLERLRNDGSRLGPPVVLSGPGGLPKVFDIDRDGVPEIYLPRLGLAVAIADGSVRHQLPAPALGDTTHDRLLADLNSDGAVDEITGGNTLQVVDAITRRLWPIPSASPTLSPDARWGAGALIDSNGDGAAELFVGGFSNALLRPTNGSWPITYPGRRSLRDGELRLAVSSGLAIPPAAAADLQPDAWIGDLRLRSHSAEGLRYEVTVRNRGLKPLQAPVSVSLYRGPRDNGGVWLAGADIAALGSSREQTVLFAAQTTDVVYGWIYAYVDTDEAIAEATLHNNRVAAHTIDLQMRNQGLTVATQRHNIQVKAVATNFSVSGSLPATVNVGHAVTLALLPNRPDPDGAPYFSFSSAPRGARVDPWTGVLTWTPTAADVGTRYLYVTVTYSDGSTGSASLWTQVLASTNAPPAITSAAPGQATAGALWQYPVVASDPDNDTLSYALTGAPTGMSINAATGLVQWTPTTAQSGGGTSGTTYSPTVRVTDTAGNLATQTFSVVARMPTMTPPTFTTVPPMTAKVGCTYVYAANAVQQTGTTVTYKLSSPPTGMTVNTSSGRVEWLPQASQVGTHPVRLDATVTGTNALAYQQYNLRVLPASAILDVQLDVQPPFAAAGAAVTVSAAPVNAAGATTLTVTVDGQPVTLDAQGRYTFTAGAASSSHAVVASIVDGCGTAQATRTVRVVDPTDTTPPQVQLHAPANDAVITKPSDVIGTVSDDNLLSWRLALKDDQGSDAFRVIASGTNTFTNATFAKFDPTLLLNGIHILVLEATDASGNVAFDSVAVSVEGDMKVGHYSITLLDVEIPLSGIPVRVTRTYDTRRAHEDLDFGHGWSVDYQNVRVRENRKLGFSWRLAPSGGPLTPWCVRPLSDPLVTVTLPDGKVEKFKARFEPECRDFVPEVNGHLVFEPVGDTHSTLEQLSYGTLRVVEQGEASNLVDLGSPNEPVDPGLYRLSTREGLVYTIDQHWGIRTITDPVGNVITYDRTGIRHSNGRAIGFTRDANDRITHITLPDGGARRYDYSPAGDLTQSTDAAGVVFTYSYLDNPRWPHYLEKIRDALPPWDVVIARHEYDADGRLTATVDANNKRIEYTHDIAGQVEVVKDRRGNPTTYVYDSNGWVLSETNALNEQTVREYDANGNELTTRDPEQRLTTRTFDARGNLLTETNNSNETVTRTYGYFNQLKTEHDAYGRQVLDNDYWFHTGLGQETGILTLSTDGLQRQTRYQMDVCGAGGGCGNSGNLKGLVDGNDKRRSFAYDRYGNLTQETDTQGNITERSYDSMGRVLTETRRRVVDGVPQSLVTTHEYNAAGNLVRTVSPDGVETVNRYDLKGRRDMTTTAGVSRYFYYDDTGRLVHDLGPHEDDTRTRYDAEGNVIETEDAHGNTTKMVYDEANRLVETIHPDLTGGDADNPRTKQTYYKDGQLKTSTDERGNVTSYTYDEAGRQETVTHGQTQMSQSVYDKNGRRIASIDALDRTTKYVYDIAGQLTKTILPDAGEDDHDDSNNLTIDYAYDRVGRKIAETDPAGRTTRYVHSPEGQLIAVVLPNPTTGENPIGIAEALGRGEYPAATIASAGVLVTRYAYDEQGNKTTQTDALNRSTTWRYDIAGRVTRRTLPLGQFEQFAYTAKGLLDWHRDFNDQLTTFHYDTSNRLEKTHYADGKELVLTHDKLDRPLTLSYAGVTETRGYDERGRLSSVGWNDGQQIDYQYDAASNRTKLTTATRVLDFSFDELNRLKTVTEPPSATLGQSGASRVTTYGYDSVGNRDHVLHANGTRVDYRYDRLNRLTNLTHRKGAAVLLALGYALNPDGTRAAIAEHVQRQDGQGQYVVDGSGDPVLDESRTTTYAYDAVKRLTSEIVTSPNADKARTTTWQYDRVGNRLTQTHVIPGGPTVTAKSTTTAYHYDSNDRLLTETATTNGINRLTTHRYDLNGSLTETTTPEQTTMYRYDGRNKMTQVERQIGGTLNISQYTYTADGIRRSQIQRAGAIDAKEIRYLVDPNQSYAQVIEERVGAPLAAGGQYASLNLKAAYTYGDDLLGQYALRDGQGNLLPNVGTPNPIATASTFHYDGLGSTRLLTDSAGNTIDAYAYDAFGELDRQASLLQTLDQPATDYQYTGEQHDPNLGFYYLRARYMDPASGRFTQQDSFAGFDADPKFHNKYAYGNSNPVTYIDPSGYVSLSEQSVAQQAIGNLATVANTGQRIIRVYDRINSVKELVLGVRQVINQIAASGPDWASAFPGGNNWQAMLGRGQKGIDFSDAADKFAQMAVEGMMVGSANWISGYVSTSVARRGKGLDAYILYMPSFRAHPQSEVTTGAKIDGIPLKLVFGGPSGKFGSLMGLGVRMNGRRQLLRMDWHEFDPKHGGSSGIQPGELKVLKKSNYHMHVYKWNGRVEL